MTEYNGWTNFETWLVNLWMSNDQGSQEYCAEQAQEAWDDAETDPGYPGLTRTDHATASLSETLKANSEEGAQDWMGTQSGMFADMLNAALSSVNWYEIADRLMEDVEWEQRFAELKAYKEAHGDCNVPALWPENPQLASWVSNQRTAYSKNKLSEELS
jgi:hypothetical protein